MAVAFTSSPASTRRFFNDRNASQTPFRIFRDKRMGFVREWTPVHKGQVYVATCDGLKSGVYKIGKSTDHFSRRSQALSQPTGVPGRYFPVYRLESDHFDLLEKSIFHVLQAHRLQKRKEFVECPLEQIISALGACHRHLAPGQAFAEYFYYPIEEFETALAVFYHDFLIHPDPRQWPRICVFLSLISGLTPLDVLTRIGHQGEELEKLLWGAIELQDVSWLLHYMRSLMRHDYLPFGRELSADDASEDTDFEVYQWYLSWFEELLWDAIYSCDFLRKVHMCLHSDSTETFCLSVYEKACQYLGLRLGIEKERAQALPCAPSKGLDFQFI